MSNNNVAILSIMSKFDEKSAKDAAKRANKVYDEELSNLGNVNFDEKLLKNFDKAMNLLKGKFKKVNLSSYTNNLLDSIFSDKDIKEKSTDINSFIKKIDLLKKASSGQDINAFNTFSAKQIDALIGRTEKLAKKQKEINEKAREYNREATKIAKPSRTVSTIDKKYGSQDYSKTLDLLKKTLATEKDFTKEQNESIENLAKMVQLYQTMEKSEPQKGTAENIRYSKDLLTVTQKIKEEREKIDSFTRKGATKFIDENELGSINKVSDYTIIKSKEDFVKENLNILKTQEIKLQSDLTTYISNSVQRNLQKVTSEVNDVVDKAEKRVEGLQNKIDTFKDGSSENSDNQLIENIVDETNIKTLEEIEDRLYAIYDKDFDGEATNKELKEYIQLYKQYSDLISKDNTVKSDPSLKEEYEFILQQSDSLKRYSEQLDNIINKNKEINTEVKNTNKSIKDQNNSVDSYNNLESDLKEIKYAISGINEKIDSINNSSSFENIETQLSSLDERVLSVSGHVDKLIDSVNLLSSLSLSDIQKTTLPLYNGINELFKVNNGNRISGYWEDLKKKVEGSNAQLRELLKNVGLFDSKSNQLKLISDGMENSGGIIGDDKVLIARKNHGKNFEEKTLLKQKLDEAYKAGVNVSRILDIIGSKESDVFFDIQEKAQGNILGNIYGQGEDFVNTDWLEATDEQINKFVSDLVKLQEMGINVESNLTNIMYDKKNGFSFIDMDLDTTKFDNNAELLQDHMMRIFGDLEDFYLDNNDATNANIVSKARKRFESLSKQVQQAYAEAQDSHSPSKDFQQLENDAVDGIVIGANENEGKLKNIGKQMAENVKEGFKEGIKNISLDELNILSDTSLQSKISDSVTDQIIANNKKKHDATKAQEKVNDTKKINSILDKSFDTKNEWFDLNSAIKIIKDKSSYKELSYGFDGFHEEVQKITSAIVNMNEEGQESTIDYMIQVQKLLNLYEMYRKEAEIPKNMSQAKKFESFLENEQLNAYLNPELDTDSNIFKGFINVIDQFIDVTTNKFIPLETRVQEIISEFGQISTITSSTSIGESNISSGNSNQKKDVFQDSSAADTKPEAQGMEQIEKVTEEAVQAKKDFATANEGVQSSIDSSENPLKLEAELMEQIAKSAREAADAKKEFVEANKQVKASANDSNSENKKKDKYAKRSKISEDDFLNNSNKYSSIANEKLSNSGYTILGGTVNSDLIDGLVKVSAKIKDVDGNWKTFSARIDADGNMFSQRFRTITKGVNNLDNELANFGKDKIKIPETDEQVQKFKELNTAIDDYASVRKRIENGKAFDKDEEGSQNLLKLINEIMGKADGSATILSSKQLSDAQDKLDKIDKTISEIQQKNAQKVDNSLLKIQNNATQKLSTYNDSSKYTPEFIERVSSKISEIEQLDITKPEDVSRLKEIDSEVQKIVDDSKLLENKLVKQDSKIADLISQMKIFSSQNTNMSSSQKQLLSEMITYAERLEQAGKTNGKEFDDLRVSFAHLKSDVASTGNTGKNFFSQIGSRLTDMNSKFIAQFLSWQDWIRYLQQASQIVTQINTNIVELAKVSEQSSKQIYADFDSYANIAKKMGSTISDTISATADWSRNGYNIPDAKELAEVALLYKNVGDGINIDEANESLISTLRGFKLEADQAEHIIDVFNEVSNNEAISSAGIGDALQRSAAAFNAANTSLEKSVALVTATNSVIQDPDKVGYTYIADLYSNVMKIKVAISVNIQKWTRPSKDLYVVI